jgi:hypothetical protein
MFLFRRGWRENIVYGSKYIYIPEHLFCCEVFTWTCISTGVPTCLQSTTPSVQSQPGGQLDKAAAAEAEHTGLWASPEDANKY